MELIQPFQTDMERSIVIGRLKSGHISPELSDKFPTLVSLTSGSKNSWPIYESEVQTLD